MVSTIYLVTQVGIAELRNANRLITGCLQPYSQKLEIVLNRYKDMKFGMESDAVEKALTRQADWRIPNDYEAVIGNAKHRNAIGPEGVENSAGDPEDGPDRVGTPRRTATEEKEVRPVRLRIRGLRATRA